MPSLIVLGLIVLLIAIVVHWRQTNASNIQVLGDVLVVFAHPDDEAMFFSPLLDYLRRHNIQTHFLCLSNGNYEGLGAVREKELLRSAEYFNVQPGNVRIVDHPTLRDGMKNLWDTKVVCLEVLSYLQSARRIRTVVTFDTNGVSYHPNHIAVYEGVRLALKNMPPGIMVLSLRTRHLLDKYVGILAAACSALSSNHRATSSRLTIFTPFSSLFSSYQAMRRHESQLVWFRYLFVLFSSYTYVNEFEELV
ncbi:putative GlcNAc PI de N acetylase [Trypanosoma vivax]|uniref:N-acetylglucosaminylphosphatidylinositol deacetylase n=1 Tax=Trypanosoma vivax (strain Y486) TaxID=1055687 RepID=G0UDA8_TRYVY|nr:putative N-acetylglucosaminyl-phosphatidylinositol deacetylase [Trypanosoma vivax]KAH8604986.1 putative GlcNAc PI de N acetylase [Trypanosoma vivax]CCC53819.1 putative N-acetylglucosaminyl-phosphatidylinositol deacetylase [Trypanosoma vivax Y486]